MKVALLIAAHGRPQITEMVYNHINQSTEKRLRQYGISLLKFVVATEDEDLFLAKKYGFTPVYAENKPLGQKFNIGLAAAMQHQWDYLLQLGSDDILTNYGTWLITEAVFKKRPWFGFKNLLVHCSQTKQSKWVLCNSVFGAGRGISRQLLENTVCIQPVWDPEINRGLDRNSEENIRWTNFDRIKDIAKGPKALPSSWPGGVAVIDIKSKTNINPFGIYQGRKVNFNLDNVLYYE